MKRLFHAPATLIPIVLLLALFTPEVNAQAPPAHDDYAIVVFKYNSTVNIWSRPAPDAPFDVAARGKLYRTFPTGPKIAYGDARIPEGIHRGWIQEDGSIRFYVQVIPEMFETYHLAGPSLDYNTLPMHEDIWEQVKEAALQMRDAGHRNLALVILPGTLEEEVAEKLARARNVREGQTLEDVQRSCQRWKEVEEYMIRTGRIPMLRFDGADIEIIETQHPSLSIAGTH
ncbi:hypothetical protein KQI65_15685 [bacterium]|nr:hypothetical protein [bacterium]